MPARVKKELDHNTKLYLFLSKGLNMNKKQAKIKEIYKLADTVEIDDGNRLLRNFAVLIERGSLSGNITLLSNIEDPNRAFFFVQEHEDERTHYVSSVEICKMGFWKQLRTYFNSSKFKKLNSSSTAIKEINDAIKDHKGLLADEVLIHWTNLVELGLFAVGGPSGYYSITIEEYAGLDKSINKVVEINILNEAKTTKLTAILVG